MEQLLLGIDIGTSACKAALFRPNGEVVGQGGADYPVYYPRPGWVEQDPEDWWNAACAAVREVLEKSGVSPGMIAAVGVDGQSWAAVAVDGQGHALCNSPLWMDTRAAGICEASREHLGEERLFRLAGNSLQASYTMPKVLWYRQELPEIYGSAGKVLQANGFVVARLTGEMTQDLSQGYGWACFDMGKGVWDRELCRDMGVDPRLLPEIAPCHQVVGRIREEAARRTGLAPGTPVVAGGLDAACGALGAGVVRPGQTQEQGGQAGGMSICTDRCQADPRLILSRHVIPDHWLLQGGTVGGGGVVRWFEREFGGEDRAAARNNGTSPFGEMDRAAAGISPGSDGLLFLPYMAGERSPIWDRDAKGVYFGVDFSKTRAHFIRASMEGVAYSLAHNLEVAREAGADVETLRAMGGAANSRLWTQIKADVTGKRIEVPASDTATTLGAAILAGVGVGIYRDFEEAVRRVVTIKRVHEPDGEVAGLYRRGYEDYLELYETTKELMRKRGAAQ